MSKMRLDRLYCFDCDSSVIPEATLVYNQPGEERKYEDRCSSCGGNNVSEYRCSTCDAEGDYEYYPLITEDYIYLICFSCYCKKKNILDAKPIMLQVAKSLFNIEQRYIEDAIDTALNKNK